MILKNLYKKPTKSTKKAAKPRPLAKFNDICERQEVKLMLQFLKANGFFCWKNETFPATIMYKTKTQGFRQKTMITGLKGSADIIGIAPDGRFVAIEVKTSQTSRKIGLTKQQKEFRQEIELRGGIYYLAEKGVDDFIKKFADKTTETTKKKALNLKQGFSKKKY